MLDSSYSSVVYSELYELSIFAKGVLLVALNSAARYTMSVGEVAQRLGCSRQTVHDYAATGVLTFVEKMRGKVPWKYFDPEEVSAYAQKRGAADA